VGLSVRHAQLMLLLLLLELHLQRVLLGKVLLLQRVRLPLLLLQEQLLLVHFGTTESAHVVV
jgi:hypothetical protein